ncbi:MAG TPA: nuclear transport factor 2 family protein [Sporichthya sp.]|nr:nuclear transport factor 2 family protein [Sporichthya sp.]
MSENTALVERFFAAVIGQDIDTLKALVSPDCVVHEPAELPYGGEYKGLDGLLAMFGAIGRDFDFAVTGAATMDAGEGKVAVRIDATFTARASGRSTSFPIAELYTLSGGQIVDIDVFYKEPGAVRALLDA